MFNNVSIGDGLLVTVFSMAIVFIVLVAISFLIDILRKTLAEDGTKKQEVKEIEVKEEFKEEPVKSKEMDDEELVAVIAAAIACSMGVELPDINIKSIKRVSPKSTAWQNVARQEQIIKNI